MVHGRRYLGVFVVLLAVVLAACGGGLGAGPGGGSGGGAGTAEAEVGRLFDNVEGNLAEGDWKAVLNAHEFPLTLGFKVTFPLTDEERS